MKPGQIPDQDVDTLSVIMAQIPNRDVHTDKLSVVVREAKGES